MLNTPVTRRYSKEELAQRGDSIFESKVRPQLTAGDDGKFVALDIETEAYELARDEVQACELLRARVPVAQIWLVRVGSPYVHRFGGRERRHLSF